MWVVTTLVLLCGGVLGAANLIVAKRPNSKQLIDKLVPYQGVIGVVMLVWGVWDLVRLLKAISYMPFSGWLLFLVITATQLGLGFLLGYGLISGHILSRSAAAMEKGEMLRARLAAYQGTLGVIAIVLACLFILNHLLAASARAGLG
jgi:hypothetical protein